MNLKEYANKFVEILLEGRWRSQLKRISMVLKCLQFEPQLLELPFLSCYVRLDQGRSSLS